MLVTRVSDKILRFVYHFRALPDGERNGFATVRCGYYHEWSHRRFGGQDKRSSSQPIQRGLSESCLTLRKSVELIPPASFL